MGVNGCYHDRTSVIVDQFLRLLLQFLFTQQKRMVIVHEMAMTKQKLITGVNGP